MFGQYFHVVKNSCKQDYRAQPQPQLYKQQYHWCVYYNLMLDSIRGKLGVILTISLLLQLTISQSKLKSLLPELEEVIAKAKENIWAQMEPEEPLWNMPPWLGTFFLSEYYFELKALQLNQSTPFRSQFNETYFTAKLLREQLPDGSWKQLADENKKSGFLDATIFNYWYLKEVGTDMLSPAMMNARKFILDQGGLEKAQVMSKYKLAAFGQYEWHLLNYIPLSLFQNTFPLYSYGYVKDYVAQWVYPHLTALAYLRYHKTILPVSKVCLGQLLTTRGHLPCEASKPDDLLKTYYKFNGSEPQPRDQDVDHLLSEAMKLTGPKESFGGYTISTLLNLLSLKDYSMRYDSANNVFVTYFNSRLNTSLAYVESLYFIKRVPYEGCLCNGKYWDSILASFALLEAGESPQKLHHTIEYLIKHKVQANGGIPYGEEFEYAPDIDDTGMLLALYGKMQKFYRGTPLFDFYEKEVKRTFAWIKSNQNSDGGFPAFEKDKNDNQYPLVKFIFWITKIDKSAEIFDPSCPDIVGHILQGMGDSSIADQDVILKTLEYLHSTREDGMWSARWGINYVYAVGAVYPGLAKIGFNLSEPWILNITKRLVEVQQADGGFGQDYESYNVDRYVEGATTASMTAWGLLAYIEAAHTLDIQENIFRAANYLISNFKANGGKFWDRSVVGTGHRGILNLQYPVYSMSFPLVALARLRELIAGRKQVYVNERLMSLTHNVTRLANTDL